MKLALRKKLFAMKKWYFQSIISLHAIKLALNKSMHGSDNEQGISKLWPYGSFDESFNYHKQS